MSWLDNMPLTLLIIVSIALLLAPVVPMPHVIEKLLMLKRGELTRALDIFDLFFHLTPTILLAIKIFRMTGKQ